VVKPTTGDLVQATSMAQIGNPLFFIPLLMLLTTLVIAYWVAGQASPPLPQRRWWSRLLIAAMHVAQPVERGWARSSMRFRTIEIPEALHRLREAWEVRGGAQLRRDQLDLWSEDCVDRHRLLERLLALAQENRWFVRVDPGWEAHDVRFYGDRWCKANLVTVTENHGGAKRLTRVRLKLLPTLYHNAALFMLAYVLVLVWFLNQRFALILVPPLVAVAWLLRSSRRRLRRTLVACILASAEKLGMTLMGAPELLRRAPAVATEPRQPEPGAAKA
jgi:hypothetical protein